MKANLRLIARMLLIVALLSSVLACQNAGQSSGIQSGDRAEDEKNPELSLLRKYGWTVEGEPKETTMELPNPVDKLLATRLYVLASKRIGLDFSNQAGKTLPLRTYKVINEVERGHDIRAYLLVADKKVVGAWLSIEGSESAPNIYALNVNPHKRN